MQRKFLFVFFCSVICLNLACSSASVTNSNTNAGNSANQQLPEGLSASPLPTTGTTPGIPDPKTVNMNSLPKGATPTPGIPDPKEANKPFKPGATPTPGIPSQEELKRQMNSPANANQAPAGQSNGQSNQVKTVRKP